MGGIEAPGGGRGVGVNGGYRPGTSLTDWAEAAHAFLLSTHCAATGGNFTQEASVDSQVFRRGGRDLGHPCFLLARTGPPAHPCPANLPFPHPAPVRSEEHTSELQSL